jgi:hypothetical protein
MGAVTFKSTPNTGGSSRTAAMKFCEECRPCCANDASAARSRSTLSSASPCLDAGAQDKSSRCCRWESVRSPSRAVPIMNQQVVTKHERERHHLQQEITHCAKCCKFSTWRMYFRIREGRMAAQHQSAAVSESCICKLQQVREQARLRSDIATTKRDNPNQQGEHPSLVQDEDELNKQEPLMFEMD